MTTTSYLSPLDRCLRKVDHASAVTDTTTVEHLGQALDELEASYLRPGERVVALEAVIHEFERRHSKANGTPFRRFLRISVERRQNKIVRSSA